MSVYNWIKFLYTKNKHDIGNQVYSDRKLKIQKKKKKKK